jgi:pimeloyl-ACP methyl ester carboxylesterase
MHYSRNVGQYGERLSAWHHRDTGSGRRLILLHGIGMSHAAWNSVTPHLSSTRRVIEFDIPGFGLTPPLPKEKLPTIANLVDGLQQSLRIIGIETPVDIAGNSLGGGMALEAARRGIARSVVAISPIGLWRTHAPPHVKYVFGSLRFVAKTFPNLLKSAMQISFLRELALYVPVSPGSRRIPVCDALHAVKDIERSTAFEETFDNTHTPFAGGDFRIPVTVAFGERDWILTRSARMHSNLPAHTRWVSKRAWGHVPMWIDPAGVSQLILDGTE